MRPAFRSPSMLIALSALLVACAEPGTNPAGSGNDPDPVVHIGSHGESLHIGGTLQLTATVTDRDGTALALPVTWTSADPGVASVSALGQVSALTVGTANIIARAGAAADTARLSVTSSFTVSISPDVLSLPSGDTMQLTVQTTGAFAASQAPTKWATTDSSVVVVDADNVMRAIGEGDAVVTAAVGTSAGSATVKVTKSQTAYVAVVPVNNTITVGQTLALSASAFDAFNRATKANGVSWTSSDASVASVDGRGNVKAVARGSVTISATIDGKRASASVTVLPTPISKVTVALAATKLSPGQTTTATATLTDNAGQTATGRAVAWQSSNPALVTVTAAGLVTAVAPGNATVSAISEGKVGNAPLDVTPGVAASIEITPADIAVRVGETSMLAAKVKDALGSVLTGRTLTWASSNPAVATVAPTGQVTGVGAGTTTATVTADGVTATAALTVNTVRVASVRVTGPTQVAVGSSIQLVATPLDANSNVLTGRLTSWTVDQAAIARVNADGSVTGVAGGTATVTATIDGQSASVTITVPTPPPAPVASVAVTLGAASIKVGLTTPATVVAKDAAGTVLTGRSVTWTSSDPSLATISAAGLVTAKAAGSLTLTATVEGQTGVAALTVDAPPPAPVASVTLTPNSNALIVGQTTQVVVTLKDASGAALSTRAIAWGTSSTAMATVSPSGMVTALGAGQVTITATSEGQSGTTAITVTAPTPPPNAVATVQVSLATSTLLVGQATQASAELRDAANTLLQDRGVTWTSSNPNVATVSIAGVVTAVTTGTASIIGMAEGKTGQATLTVATPPTTSANKSWYASPTGSMIAPGTQASPWSLETALGHPGLVQPGDTIYLLGGTYKGDFISRLTGTAQRPIVLRQAPGARATIDGRFAIEGQYTYYWGFEVMYSDPRRVTSLSGSDPVDLPREFKTVFVTGPFNKLINLVVHDLGDGIFSGMSAEGLEIYGSVIYNNGWRGPDRGHGHNVYLQNATPTKYLTDNVLFNSFSSGLHIYGSDAASLYYFSIEGNTIFESGAPVASTFAADRNIVHTGAGGKFGRSVYRRNSIYQHDGTNYSFEFNSPGDTPGEDIQFIDNISQGRAQFHEVRRYTVTGNKMTTGSAILSGQTMLLALRMAPGESFASHTWDRNSYAAPLGDQVPFYLVNGEASGNTLSQWRATTGYDVNSSFTNGKFTGADVVVRPNKYEPGRALVTCWNWSNAGSLAVDLSTVLKPGDRYEIRHVYDLFGTPLVSGTYTGGSVSIPQTTVAVPMPFGYSYAAAAPGPGFGAFIVQKQ